MRLWHIRLTIDGEERETTRLTRSDAKRWTVDQLRRLRHRVPAIEWKDRRSRTTAEIGPGVEVEITRREELAPGG